MAHILLVRESDDKIKSVCHFESTQVGHRVINLVTAVISGDDVPADTDDMVNGTLDTNYVYTAPPDTTPDTTKIDAMKALDPSNETGTIKTILEFLQERF